MSDTDLHQIPEYSTPGEYTVKLMLQVPGPKYPRRKYTKYRLLTVEGTITLPFIPYPGLYLTFSKPHWRKKKKDPARLYLRIRTVEWQVAERYFECVADETFAREPGFELQEVRGSPHIEMHFVELQKTFEHLGFDVATDMDAISWAYIKRRVGLSMGCVRIALGWARIIRVVIGMRTANQQHAYLGVGCATFRLSCKSFDLNYRKAKGTVILNLGQLTARFFYLPDAGSSDHRVPALKVSIFARQLNFFS